MTQKNKFSLWFVWIPIIITIIVLATLIIIKVSSKETSWTSVVAWSIVSLVISGIVSGIIYYFTIYRQVATKEREFNGREKCFEIIMQEMRLRHFVEVEQYIDIQKSVSMVGFYGKEPKTKIFTTLVKTKETMPQYLLIGMNMEKGKEDDISIANYPHNFATKDLIEVLRRKIIDELTEYKEQYDEARSTIINPITNTTQSIETKKPIQQGDDEE